MSQNEENDTVEREVSQLRRDNELLKTDNAALQQENKMLQQLNALLAENIELRRQLLAKAMEFMRVAGLDPAAQP